MIRRHLLLALPAFALLGCATPSSEPPILVFFEADSAALEGAAVDLIRGAAASAARQPGSPVQVLGFAGTTGGRPYNVALSRSRAEHVADELRKAGVASGRIRVSARGPVPFELAEQESRRVEIRFGE